jgi:hypothetical protein
LASKNSITTPITNSPFSTRGLSLNAREDHRNHRNNENGLEPAQGNVMKISVLHWVSSRRTMQKYFANRGAAHFQNGARHFALRLGVVLVKPMD